MPTRSTTLPTYGQAEDLFPISDRRASPRFRTVCFDVKIDRAASAGLFRARNLSDSGMMLHTHVPLDVGERVRIGLSDHLAIRGTILWCNERCSGVGFERPIDSAALLRAEAAHKRDDRRGGTIRLDATTLATTYAENGIRAVRVMNVSHRGMGLAHDGTLSPGMWLKLIAESGLERDAAVRWSANGRAGIRLTEPLTCRELESVGSHDRRAADSLEPALVLTD